MFDNEINLTKTILVSVDLGEYDAESSLDELEELSNTAGAEVIARLVQKRPSIENATYLGQGKLEELKELCENLKPELVVFDDELTATQIRNIEDVILTHVIDRTMLILDIFAQRAKTAEGKLQVELAQQKYRLPRLAGMGVTLSRLGGGIGTRGPGETKLETDKRHIRSRIEVLSAELKKIEKRRELSRARRKKDDVLSVAIVGYTNVGKSTLLNSLTQAGVLAENKLFATLETTSRAILIPDGRSVLLIDTVGLISRLPHNLVEAFKSTLEEASSADVILHICDASNENVEDQAKVTLNLLAELGCEDIPVVTVLNKCDLVPEINFSHDENVVKISAKEGKGFDDLLVAIQNALPKNAFRMNVLIPYEQTALLNLLRNTGKVFSEEYVSNGIKADCLVDKKILYKIEQYKI